MRLPRSNIGYGLLAIAFAVAMLLLGNFFTGSPAQLGGVECSDGRDNNANGKIDTVDIFCTSAADTTEGDPTRGHVANWTVGGGSRIVQQCAPAGSCNRPEWVGTGGTNATTIIVGLSAGDVVRATVSGTVTTSAGVQVPCSDDVNPGGPSVLLQFLDAAGNVVAIPGDADGALALGALADEVTVPPNGVTLVAGVGDTVNSDNTGGCTLSDLLVFGYHDNSGAECSIVTAPNVVPTGSAFTATFSLKNTGSIPWVPGTGMGPGYKLMSMSPFDNGRWGTGRIQLPVTVNPGQTVTVTANLTAPQTPGSYPFDWEMGDEDVARFGQACRKTITVSSPSDTVFCPADNICTKQGVASNCLTINPVCPSGTTLQWASQPASCGTTGCSGQCYACTTPGSSSSAGNFCAVCGDGVVVTPEECDHGAQNGQDNACSATCTLLKPAASSSSSSSIGVCTDTPNDGTATRTTVIGDKDGFGIGLAPSTTYQNIRSVQKGCDEPLMHDAVSYGTGWGNRPLPAGYNGTSPATAFTLYIPKIVQSASIGEAILTLHVADMDDGQPGVNDRLFIDGQEIPDAFTGAGSVQYLADPAGKTGIVSFTITTPSVLESLRDGQASVRIDDVTTNGTAPEFFSIDYAEVSVTYSCDASAAELCNGMDDNCDGRIDEELTTNPYYVDMDGNGRAGTLVGHFCASPGYGTTTMNETCAQSATQCADGEDNDQDGLIDAYDPGCHSDNNAANTQTFNAADDSEGATTGGQCQNPQYSLGTMEQVLNTDPDNGVVSTFGQTSYCDSWPTAVLTGITYKDRPQADAFSMMTPRCQYMNENGTLGAVISQQPTNQYTLLQSTPVQSFCPSGMFAVGIYQKDVDPSAPVPDQLDGIVLACASVTDGVLGSPQQAPPVPQDLSSNIRPFQPVLCPENYVLTGYFYMGDVADSIKYLRCRALSYSCPLNP